MTINVVLIDKAQEGNRGKSIDCPTYISVKATSQSEGDIHLSDVSNWGISKALIKMIRVITSSTDWDLYILQNDNGYAVDDANIPKMQIMGAGSGNATIHLDMPYEDSGYFDYAQRYHWEYNNNHDATESKTRLYPTHGLCHLLHNRDVERVHSLMSRYDPVLLLSGRARVDFERDNGRRDAG